MGVLDPKTGWGAGYSFMLGNAQMNKSSDCQVVLYVWRMQFKFGDFSLGFDRSVRVLRSQVEQTLKCVQLDCG